MKKIINNPENYVDDMLEGLYAAYPGYITYADELRCLVKSNKVDGKVGIVTGGGSGHLPLFLGYVGDGMLDGCAVGDVFQSPSADQIATVTKNVDSGAGVLYIFGNYSGDILNFDMAAEMVDFEDGIRTETVIAGEDVASAAPSNPGEPNRRRGVAGIVFVYKCAGAAAVQMKPIEEVKRIAEKAAANVRSMGVALTPCTIPAVGRPGFTIAEDEMSIGMGIHGEAGIRTGKLESAEKIVDEILTKILSDLPFKSGDTVSVLVNGLGATPLDEQFIVTGCIDKKMKQQGINVHRYYVGEFATAMEMAGFSISVIKLDDELKHLLDVPANTPFFKQI